MCNLYAKYVKILEICKSFSENLVNAAGNVPRRGVVPRFTDVEVVALSMTAEAEGIDSECLLFNRLKEFGGLMPNLCCIIGGKGYIGADIQLDIFETARIRLECPKRSNQKDWKPVFAPFAKARKRIETVFSQLDDQFMMKRNYAKKTQVLFARVIGKVGAFTVLQYINSVNGRPVSRVKYALDS